MQLLDDSVERFIPRDCLPLSCAALTNSFEWRLDAIGGVKDLETGLSRWSKPTAIDGIERIAFDLDGNVIHQAHTNAASARTELANGRNPTLGSGNQGLRCGSSNFTS